MNEQTCESVRELLVDYADGELPAESARPVADHLAACPSCRRELAALRQSLALAREVWSESAVDPAVVLAFRPRRRMRALAAAVAACILLAVGAPVVWRSLDRGGQAPDRPPVAALSSEQLQRLIHREDMSARIAASARILSLQPGGEEAAEEAYRYLARAYPDTAAGRQAARKIPPDQGVVQ